MFAKTPVRPPLCVQESDLLGIPFGESNRFTSNENPMNNSFADITRLRQGGGFIIEKKGQQPKQVTLADLLGDPDLTNHSPEY